MGFLDFLKDTIGIDPGSQNLRMIKDGELIFNETTEISLDKSTNIISGLGNSTRRTDNDVIIQPVDCSITNFHAFEMLLRGAIKKGFNAKSIISKTFKMYFCIPTSATEIDMRAYRDSAEHAGASEVYMIYQSCCSAIGLNVLFEQKHFILVDIGHSKIEMTVFANSLPISVGVVRMGTSKIYRLLKNFLKRKYKINVTDKEVDFILTAFKRNDEEIKIQHTLVKVSELKELLDNFFTIVHDEFSETIERVTGHSDIQKIITTGVYFTGGGSTIDFFREQICLDDRIKMTVSQTPLLDNINGLKRIMTDRDRFKNYIIG